MKRQVHWPLVVGLWLAIGVLACGWGTTASPTAAPFQGNAASPGGSVGVTQAPGQQPQDMAPPVVADLAAPGTVFMGGSCSPTMLSVSVRVTDDTGLSAVWLFYRYPGHTDFLQVPMTAAGGGYYTVQIPAGSEGARFYSGQAVPLEFQIQAVDVAGKTVRYPDIPVQVSVQPCLPQASAPSGGGSMGGGGMNSSGGSSAGGNSSNAPGGGGGSSSSSGGNGGYAGGNSSANGGSAGAPPNSGGNNSGGSSGGNAGGGNTGTGGGSSTGGTNNGNDNGAGGVVEAPPDLQQPPSSMTFDPNQVDPGGNNNTNNNNGNNGNNAGNNNNNPGGQAPANVQFCNTSQSPIVSLVFRYTDAQGVQREEEVILNLSQVIATGNCLTVSDFQPGITYAYVAAAGFWNAQGKTVTRYLAAGTLVLQSGETRSVTISEPPAPQVLTEFGTTSSYCGMGWVGAEPYSVQMDFDAQQPSYTLWLNGQVLYNGTYQEVQRSPSLLVLQFDQGFSGSYKYAFGEISLTDIPMGNGQTMLFVSLTKMGCSP